MPAAPGRDQRAPMERLIRLATVLHHAGERGVPAERLLAVAGFEDGRDGSSQLAREFRHLRELGWQIENIGASGGEGRYRITSVDNRLRVRLDPGQQRALRRAILLADREDLAQRLGLPDDAGLPGLAPVPLEESDPALAVVTRALRQGSRMRFRYRGSPRVVHPSSVRAHHGVWYVRGREEGGHEVKSFVVSRMSDLAADEPGTAAPGTAGRHPGLHPMTWEIDPPIEVTLVVPDEHVTDVRRSLLEPLHQTPGPAGHTRLVYRVTHRAALRSRIYELGTRVHLEGPEEIRAEILSELAEMAGE